MRDYALSSGHYPHRQGKLKYTSHLLSRLVTAHFVAVTVPTGVTGDTVAHTPAAIHDQLLKENPSYCRLWITQLPTWVWCLDLYGPGSSSSVTFAFEDPDGSLLTSLLSSWFFFLFGVQSTLRKWINCCTTLAKLNATKHKKGLLKLQNEQDKFFTQKDKEDKIASDFGLACPVTPVASSSGTSSPPPHSPPTPLLPPSKKARGKCRA